MADRAVGIPIVKEGLPFVGGLVGATLLFGAAGWIIPAVIAAVYGLVLSEPESDHSAAAECGGVVGGW